MGGKPITDKVLLATIAAVKKHITFQDAANSLGICRTALDYRFRIARERKLVPEDFHVIQRRHAKQRAAQRRRDKTNRADDGHFRNAFEGTTNIPLPKNILAVMGEGRTSPAMEIARRIQYQLETGRFDAARQEIDDAQDQVKHPTPKPRTIVEFFALPLASLAINDQTLTLLEKKGMVFVGDVLRRSRRELLCVPHISHEEVKKLIREVGRLKDQIHG